MRKDLIKDNIEIANVIKFIDNSRFETNSKEHIEIIESILNMLKCVASIYEKTGKNKKENETKQKNTKSDETATENPTIKILKSIGSIIEPGLTDKKLSYALCVEYKKTAPDEENQTDDIVCFQASSSGSVTEPMRSNIKFSTDGLIYNLMKGLTTSGDNNTLPGEQSLLAAIKEIKKKEQDKEDIEFYSFSEKYTKNNGEPEDFKTLYKNDTHQLEILKNADMALFFRLSALDQDKLASTEIDKIDKEKKLLIGKAVLIITYSGGTNKGNYIKFMSNEKIRLISLIKNDILNYLKEKIIDNDSFVDWLRAREADEHIKTMEHNVQRFFDPTRRNIDALREDHPKDKNIIICLLRFNIMKYHLLSLIPDDRRKEQDIENNDNRPTVINEEEMKELFDLILETPYMNVSVIDKNTYKDNVIVNIPPPGFQCPEYIYYYVLPELFFNIRKNTSEMHKTKPEYSIIYENEVLVISNTYIEELKGTGGEHKGIKICKKKCKALDYILKVEDSQPTGNYGKAGSRNEQFEIKKYTVTIYKDKNI